MSSDNGMMTPPQLDHDPEQFSSHLSQLPDAELMELVKRSNHDAFAYLFDRYHRLVLMITSEIVRDDFEAEDLMQDIFFEIYRKADLFDPARGDVKPWIMRYAYTRSFNRQEYLKVRKFYDPSEIEEAEQLADRPLACVWRGLAPEEFQCVLEAGLARLSEKQRRTVVEVCYQGRTMEEIAADFGESARNIRHHYYRGLTKLRAYVVDGPASNLNFRHMEGVIK
jgi:RNA polymerase sigma-70 factor (ECF subfamily)